MGIVDKFSEADRYRFWAKVDKSSNCWEWQAFRNPKGYGRFSYKRSMLAAHRVSYQLELGEIPEGLHICHSCDNPPCVNPAHLFLGTNRENVLDSLAKGRRHNKTGSPRERLPQTRFLQEEIADMVARYDAGETQKSIAASYECSQQCVHQIVSPRSTVSQKDRSRRGGLARWKNKSTT